MAELTSWYFRELDPGEAHRGGVDNFAFQMSIDTLVRETIQNSNDQRVGKKVIVEFIHEVHTGKSAEELLELIGWEKGLKKSLESIASGESHLSRRALRVLTSAKALKFSSLTIRDISARGLEGDEDGETGNFVMLCRHVLVTDAARKALRGGSFGIGKSVLWAFSGASVALFSSLPAKGVSKSRQDPNDAPRVFGRAYLVSHKIGDSWHNSDGHFGNQSMTNGKRWATSVRGEAASSLVRGTALDRDWKETGTSILIPFLDNPSMDEDLSSSDDVVKKIREAVQKWFWPSIDSGTLEVRVGTRIGASESLQTVELPAWVSHFLQAMAATSSDKIEEEGGCAWNDIPIEIPQREIEPKHGKLRTRASLHLMRLTDAHVETVPENLRNTVALVRGARMVVQYHDKSFSPLMPPFVGVLKAGEFRGNEEGDSAMEAFLRDSEPPAHDKWDSSSAKLGDNYKRGAHATVIRFFESMGAEAKKLLGSSSQGSGKVPKKLAELLRGGKGGPKRRIERFEMSSKQIDRSTPGQISAIFTIRRNLGSNGWKATSAIVLLDEQGTGRELHHVSVNDQQLLELGIVTTPIAGKSPDSVRSFTFDVPKDVSEFEARIVASVSNSNVANRAFADVKTVYSQPSRGQA